ncbi:unnamed protein product, partial [Musa hybrid cultivar]
GQTVVDRSCGDGRGGPRGHLHDLGPFPTSPQPQQRRRPPQTPLQEKRERDRCRRRRYQHQRQQQQPRQRRRQCRRLCRRQSDGHNRPAPPCRPPGSKNKPRPPVIITRESPSALCLHVLEIASEPDIAEAVTSFTAEARRRRNPERQRGRHRRHASQARIAARGRHPPWTLRHPLSFCDLLAGAIAARDRRARSQLSRRRGPGGGRQCRGQIGRIGPGNGGGSHILECTIRAVTAGG